ncbi:MAG: hypothetical protein XE08_0547 [Parcubacteria bacterium 32_520]|nr:MAG: hypothetical protein XE08_0547 [Parcubacteria bacterium 32_520]
MTEKRQRFIDQLQKQLTEKNIDHSIQEWLFQKTAEVILMINEKSRLSQKVYELQLKYNQIAQEIIMENPDLSRILQEMETLTFQVKTLDVQADKVLEQIYDVIEAKLGDLDLEDELELPEPEPEEEVEGYG